jgi:hypothetical protein
MSRDDCDTRVVNRGGRAPMNRTVSPGRKSMAPSTLRPVDAQAGHDVAGHTERGAHFPAGAAGVVTPVSVPLPGSASAEAAVFPRISPNSLVGAAPPPLGGRDGRPRRADVVVPTLLPRQEAGAPLLARHPQGRRQWCAPSWHLRLSAVTPRRGTATHSQTIGGAA